MATTIKDSVYKAIDVIVGKRIEDLHLDKTIEATVIKCVNLSDKKYELKYGSGIFYAYARQNEIYTPNSTVYVLVPENNFNKTKWIIGKANTGSQTNINESQSIATMTSGYSIIGKNILSYKTDNTTIGLNSDIGSQYIILYDAKQNNKANLINVNNEALKIYLQESQGFIFSAQFQSNLSKRQITGREDFGLIFNLRLKNGKTSFPTLQDRWEAQEPNTQCTIDNKEIRLNDLREKVEQLWTTTSVSEENIDYSNITVDFLQEQLSNYVIELQAFAQELTFLDDQTAELVKLYIQLIDDLSAYTLNNNNNPITIEDIINLYYEWFTNESYAFQETIYTVILNTEKMTGNPYYLFSPTYQYTFSEIDPETFIGIESIYFYSECPSGTHNLANEIDIRITDIGISCIKYLDNTNGDYRLDIKCSDIYFGQNASNETNIIVTAKIFYQNNTDVTPYSRIMWFKQNNNITSSSANYSIYGGLGWQQLTTTTHNIFTTTAAQNLVYKNYYKVVAMYESGTIVQQEFIIYNEKHQHNIELSSDSGTSFGIGSGQKYITCLVDNQIDMLHYQYNWYISANNNVQYKIKTQEELSELENEIKDISISLSDKAKKQQEFNVISNIIQLEDKNIIEVQSTALPLNGSINIICEVYTKDSQLLIGNANITLTNQRTINIKDYYIEIVNGNQAFQYNESGISPCSNVFEKPLIPLSLKCNFYDPMGGLINPLRYNTSWEIPIENTLIHTDTNNLTYNNVSGLNNLLISDTCTFTISDEYNYNYTNNQIVCIIEFDDGNGLVSYRQPTNFFFGKIGDHGTNGTDIITKIHVVPNDSATIRDDYNTNTLLKEKLTLIIEQTNSDIEGEYNYNYIWNNGVITDYPILQLDLFKKNELIQPSEYRKVNWSVLTNGLPSKNWKTINNNTDNTKQVVLQYDATKLSSNQNYTNYIIKAQADLPIDDNNFQTYYDFYPICTNLKYAAATETNYTVGIDSARTLQYVTYNSDGRNPLYNKNLGVGLSFKNLNSPRTIVWESHGGISTQDKLESYPSFTIGKQISYIPSYSTEIQEYLDKLEEQKTNALLEFKDNFNIFNQLNIEKNNQLDMLNEEKQKLQDLEQTYQDNLNQDREKFNQTQKDNIDYGIQRLKERIVNIGALTTNVITLTNYTEQDDESTNFNWFRIVSIDDIINPVYDSDQDFINDLYLYCTTLNDETIQVLETKFKSLVFEVHFTNDTIENPKNANIIKEYFIKFINNTVLLGYKTNKKIFDSKHQDIYDNIESTSKKKESLIEQIEIYENILINNENSQLIQYKLTEEIIIDIADINILQGIIQNFDSPNNSIMQYSEIWNLIVSVQTQYHNNLNLIAQKYDTQINFLSGILTDDTDPTFCSVIPNEIYSGEYPNQYVKVKIYQGLIDKIDDASILEHELIIPFHMSLNTYGLASLNAWDGNSVEINEDAGYVLAPQIGAGIKHPEDNTFTGILMGTEKTFDDAAGQEEIGLLGYSHGKRSIFLDAATGNATFGLPEDDSRDVSNPLTEGRIELRPGGTSSISKWNFDSRSLYRIASEDETEAIIKQRKYINQLSDTSLGEPYDDAPEYAHGSIPHTKQGILFSALPAYASFKGRVLKDEDHDKQKVEYTNANTTVRPGDTFELQIDPNDSKFFTLYEHSTRIYNGRGLYGTILDIFFATGLKWEHKDTEDSTDTGFKERFKEYLGDDAIYDEQNKIISLGRATGKIKDINNTYFLIQRYVDRNSIWQYRVLALLTNNEEEKWAWTLENCVLDNDLHETDEYAIATAKTYKDWSIDKVNQLVWTNIVFKNIKNIEKIDVDVELNDNNIITSIILSKESESIINEDTKIWHRYRKAGINALGEFSAESVGSGGLNLGLRGITAFTVNQAWVGPSFDSSNNTILKIFVSEQATASGDTKAPVFISSTNRLSTIGQNDEGQRPVRIYAGRNYIPADTAQEPYNTGIFVGQSADERPINKIAKIEFDQTSDDDSKITLSALGSNIIENSSVLTLKSSRDTSNQEGSLIHTGDWKTEIGQNLTKAIGGNSIYNIVGNISGNIANQTNKITMNQFRTHFINNTNNVLNLRSTNDNKERARTQLIGYQGVQIIGGYNNTSDTQRLTFPIQIAAYNQRTNGGNNDGIAIWSTRNNSGRNAQKGDAFLTLTAASTSVDARFQLYAGAHYVQGTNLGSSIGEGIQLGPHLRIGTSNNRGTIISGNINSNGTVTANSFSGNGKKITYTADGNPVGSKDPVSISGYGSKGSISIPYITMKNGRPTFGSRTLSITMPSAQDTSLERHRHSMAGTYGYHITKLTETTGMITLSGWGCYTGFTGS